MRLFRSGRRRYNFRPLAEGDFNVGLTTVASKGAYAGIGVRIRVQNADHIFSLCLNEAETLRLARFIQDHTTDGRMEFNERGRSKHEPF